MSKRDTAKGLLWHYICMLMRTCDLAADPDCQDEVESIVDAIIDAAREGMASAGENK
jgi:hypothetical protein